MGKKKRKKHPPKRTQAEDEQAAENRHLDNHSLKSFVSHIFSNGWVQNSGVAFLLAFVALIASIMTSTQTKAAAIVFAGAGTVFLWIAVVAVWRYAEPEQPPPFAIKIETLWQGVGRDNTQVFCEYNGRFLSPVPIVMFLSIVNRQDIPVNVSQMRIEVQLRKGGWFLPSTWLETVAVSEYMPLVWVNDSPNPSVRMTLLGPRLETEVVQKLIQPHQTVEGWILLDVPAKFKDASSPHVYRISIKDTEGHAFTVLDQGPQETGNLHTIGTIRGFTFGNAVDISKLQIRHLGDSIQDSN